MNWLSYNWQWAGDLAATHLYLSASAVVIAVLVAVPLGRLAFRFPKLGGALLSAATLIYAVPSLPLLFVVPILIGTPLRSSTTIIAALALYGAALLVRTAADAFNAVDPIVRDSAVALGYSRTRILWGVDLPLATPVLVSGIRVVTVSTVGLVTIGALIGIPSLGTLLTDGFKRDIMAEVGTGIAATVLLALVLDAVVLLVGRALTPWMRAVGRVAA